ncbi:SDR family NAD(P)-dependent oxidoreductase [Prevotella sp. P6B4]|uniref:SDR family NAD(P)-dependent oxidoreductase n=1 Tax=Prevotella sp. P6B4 TaxID=1410614 RepID=UPI00048D348D|nr:SDR family oxidoreductase [Prevotella sp. P6B4]
MFNPFSLEGKTIIVTGASSGIGRQCAIDCSRMGAKVAIIGRNEERLNETLSLMEGRGHTMFSYDFAQLDGIKDFITLIVSEIGKIDGVLCAAGMEKSAPMKLLKPSDYEEIMKVNTISAFELVRQATGVKVINTPASIVFISSITSVIARTTTAAYSASKGALVSGARVMASELAKRNIRVNCISPGTILTPLMQNYLSQLSEEDYQKRVNGFPLGLGETTDVSNACIYLLSDASRWITGQNIVVDGGYTIQ